MACVCFICGTGIEAAEFGDHLLSCESSWYEEQKGGAKLQLPLMPEFGVIPMVNYSLGKSRAVQRFNGLCAAMAIQQPEISQATVFEKPPAEVVPAEAQCCAVSTNDADDITMNLISCDNCGRKFNEKSYLIHQKSCKAWKPAKPVRRSLADGNTSFADLMDRSTCSVEGAGTMVNRTLPIASEKLSRAASASWTAASRRKGTRDSRRQTGGFDPFEQQNAAMPSRPQQQQQSRVSGGRPSGLRRQPGGGEASSSNGFPVPTAQDPFCAPGRPFTSGFVDISSSKHTVAYSSPQNSESHVLNRSATMPEARRASAPSDPRFSQPAAANKGPAIPKLHMEALASIPTLEATNQNQHRPASKSPVPILNATAKSSPPPVSPTQSMESHLKPKPKTTQVISPRAVSSNDSLHTGSTKPKMEPLGQWMSSAAEKLEMIEKMHKASRRESAHNVRDAERASRIRMRTRSVTDATNNGDSSLADESDPAVEQEMTPRKVRASPRSPRQLTPRSRSKSAGQSMTRSGSFQKSYEENERKGSTNSSSFKATESPRKGPSGSTYQRSNLSASSTPSSSSDLSAQDPFQRPPSAATPSAASLSSSQPSLHQTQFSQPHVAATVPAKRSAPSMANSVTASTSSLTSAFGMRPSGVTSSIAGNPPASAGLSPLISGSTQQSASATVSASPRVVRNRPLSASMTAATVTSTSSIVRSPRIAMGQQKGGSTEVSSGKTAVSATANASGGVSKFCISCGEKFKQQAARFCANCGTPRE